MIGYPDTNDLGLVRPGRVSVTPAALELAKKVAATVGAAWIVTFSWATRQSMRESGDAPEAELGPGLCLGGFRREQVEEEYIHRDDDLSFVIQIPDDVLAKAVNCRIEYDPVVFGRLKLT